MILDSSRGGPDEGVALDSGAPFFGIISERNGDRGADSMLKFFLISGSLIKKRI